MEQRPGRPFLDVMILKLIQAVQFDSYTTPICLAGELTENLTSTKAYIAGYGQEGLLHCERCCCHSLIGKKHSIKCQN